MRATWRMLAGRRDLRLVLSAGIISLTGDWILTIGLIYRVYAVTGSTVASALTAASSFAPQGLLGAVAGGFADRWDRRGTMNAAHPLLGAGLERLRGDVMGRLRPAVFLPRRAGHGAPAGARGRAPDRQRAERPGRERVPAGGLGPRRRARGGWRDRPGGPRRRSQLRRLGRPARPGQDDRAHRRAGRRPGPGPAGTGRRGPARRAPAGYPAPDAAPADDLRAGHQRGRGDHEHAVHAVCRARTAREPPGARLHPGRPGGRG